MEKKMKLRRETLRMLNPETLESVQGGRRANSARCSITSAVCPTTDDTWGTALCPGLPKTIAG